SIEFVFQVNEPTLEVISTPLLNACADICCVWVDETQLITPGAIVTRSTWRCVNTVTVAFSVPLVTVIVVDPGCTPVVSHTMKLASHLPAHTSPPEETVATAGFADEKVKVDVVVTAAPVESTIVDESAATSPRLMESGEGLTWMTFVFVVVELWPPHPMSADSARITTIKVVVRRCAR